MTTTSKAKLLVVEDSQDDIWFINFALSEVDKNKTLGVEIVGDGRSALEIAKSQKFDLILLDLRLPGMDGLEVLKALRESGVTTRVIVFSTSDAEEEVEAAYRSAANSYIVKPNNTRMFTDTIKAIYDYWLRVSK